MSADRTTRRDASRTGTLAVAWPALLLAAAIAFPFLGARDLWAPDEPRYAEVARETLVDGHWWYPHVNARPYPDKPPLYFWLAAAISAPVGDVSELTARVPSAVAFLLLVLVVVDLGTMLVDPAAGRLAGLVLATTWLAAWMSRRVNLDVLLALCVAACLWCGLRGSTRRGQSVIRSTAWLAGAGAAAALGVMTKGPVLLLFVVPPLVVLVVRARRDGARLPISAKAATIATFLVVLAAWLVPARVLGGYDPLGVVREHVLERATEGRDHVQPFWYFLRSMPLDLLPWSPVAAIAAVAAWKARREPGIAMLLAWAVVPVVVLSVSVEKRNIYVVPLLPAWALLCGWWLARVARLPASLVTVIASAGLAVTTAGVALFGVATISGRLPWRPPESAVELPVTVAAGAFALACLVGSALAFRRLLASGAAPTRVGLELALAFGLLEAALLGSMQLADPLKSGRAMGETIRREVGGAPLGMYPRTWDAYVYYSRRSMADLGDADAAKAWLERASRPAFVLGYRKDADVVTALAEQSPIEAARGTVGHREVVLWKFTGDSQP